MSLALGVSVLQYYGVMQVNFDSSLQTILMLAFFTTIELAASLKIVSRGGIYWPDF